MIYFRNNSTEDSFCLHVQNLWQILAVPEKVKVFKYDTFHSVFIVDVHELEDPTSCHTASKSVFTAR